jgi:hypothetical protein
MFLSAVQEQAVGQSAERNQSNLRIRRRTKLLD